MSPTEPLAQPDESGAGPGPSARRAAMGRADERPPVERRQGELRTRASKARRRGTGEDLRAAILAEARRVIATGGVSTLSTRRVAQAVGCTATSIYIYFRSKDALLHAIIDEGMQALHAHLDSAGAESTSTVGRVERLARAYIAFAFEHPTLYEVMFMLHPRHMERYPAEAYRRARQNIDALAAAIAEEETSAADLVGASTVWATLHGHVALWIAGRIDASIPRETFIEGALALIRRRIL
jgi:AcrR family transcriptional regulator